MAILAFQDAEKARDAIVASQRQEIAGLYAQWADEIERSSKRFAGGKNPSDALKSIQMQQLMRNVRSAGKIVSNGIDNVVRGNMYMVADAVVQANNEWMAELGFDTTGLNVNFTTVPERIVERLVTGQLYQGGWNLSQRIWGDNEKVMAELYQIAARGAVENKSIQEIAKDMAGHVSPSAQKPWNKVIAMKNTTTGAIEYKRMYTRKVDYNAQRLARTLVQHSYQQSFVAVTKDNPFVTDYIWHADGSRPCELCEERDGMHFAKDDLPMDHPNGMCTMEPNVDEHLIDRLADWVNSPEGTYPEIDEFAANLGYEAQPQVPVVISNVVNGVDLSQSWQRRPDQFEFEIEDVINAQGFDGLPSVVSPEEFENAVRESNFIAQRTYSAPSQEVLDAYRDQLYHGKWYIDCSTGGAQYGQGMYCAADYTGTLTEGITSEMKHYAKVTSERYKEPAKMMAKMLNMPVDEYVVKYGVGNCYTETLTLDASAKIVEYDKLVRLKQEASSEGKIMLNLMKEAGLTYEERAVALREVPVLGDMATEVLGAGEEKAMARKFARQLERDDEAKYNLILGKVQALSDTAAAQAEKYYRMDEGAFAALQGYDAINATGHGASGSYTVVLNRTKVILRNGG